MDRIQYVREINGWLSTACLVRDTLTDKHYVVSSVMAPYTGYETLVFRADKDGNVTDWLEVAGGQGLSREQALVDLLDKLEPNELDHFPKDLA